MEQLQLQFVLNVKQDNTQVIEVLLIVLNVQQEHINLIQGKVIVFIALKEQLLVLLAQLQLQHA